MKTINKTEITTEIKIGRRNYLFSTTVYDEFPFTTTIFIFLIKKTKEEIIFQTVAAFGSYNDALRTITEMHKYIRKGNKCYKKGSDLLLFK